MGSSNKKYAGVGDIIKVAVKDAAPGMPVKKNQKYTWLLLLELKLTSKEMTALL